MFEKRLTKHVSKMLTAARQDFACRLEYFLARDTDVDDVVYNNASQILLKVGGSYVNHWETEDPNLDTTFVVVPPMAREEEGE